MIQALVFYLLAAVTVVAAVMVITARNPVHSVLWLILAFVNSAGLFLVIGAEFLAMILMIVYVGAVAVLFLFVVMMLDVDFSSLRRGALANLPLGLLIGVVLAVELVVVASAWQAGRLAGPGAPARPTPRDLPNAEALGQVLYTDFVLAFQVAGLVLLVAMVGAIVLTHRERPGVRRQSAAAQTARSPAEAVVLARPTVGAGVDTDAGVR
ncbi:MAG: NADH-quinone oxidoreductase subunit J [Sphingomonadaceae bacterium]|uniref:NADH-quinone oxidoreductase subunit J n=1 Tax=Thermaurantiacus sp. TaxID=2820283 RepID=UPI00298EEDFB|nr:NADH-quinone oxidoreductase subunit J [Thermaurantiacus sp.]MCS6986679.1 NADH-quinone oxidoreductase subunit J [Sphingomonadaceae bacterium]MDW8414058.1 NADH-quinone oxidoreductase subunit J [Thermaurantiacus sp.]